MLAQERSDAENRYAEGGKEEEKDYPGRCGEPLVPVRTAREKTSAQPA
ncbi:MAG TPA: hypothetical protein VGL68_09065 [Solirubrobacteraceae bacterium]